MKVSRDWLAAFETVMAHHKATTPMTFGADEVDNCKAEARENESWAMEFYPRAAAIIAGAATVGTSR